MPAHTTNKYGWKPDLPDHRDLKYSADSFGVTPIPAAVDLRRACPLVYDQGRIGSCTANAIAGAYEFELNKQKLKDFMPSRLFIYYNERVMERSVMTDSGAMIRDGIKSVATQGVCTEQEWSYVDTPADPRTDLWPTGAKPATKPSALCYTSALKHRVSQYLSVSQNLYQLKSCLAAGYPIVFGFTVYESFESDAVAQTGTVNMPTKTESALGGHAVLCVGYNDATSRFTVRNSWGNKWGQQGYFTLPYDYLLSKDLAADFWTIRVVTG